MRRGCVGAGSPWWEKVPAMGMPTVYSFATAPDRYCPSFALKNIELLDVSDTMMPLTPSCFVLPLPFDMIRGHARDATDAPLPLRCLFFMALAWRRQAGGMAAFSFASPAFNTSSA